ncbi:unnamed protein product, partial [Brassica rapa subsp. trilocularis]
LGIPAAAAEANFTELAIVDFFKSKDAVLPLSSNLDDLFLSYYTSTAVGSMLFASTSGFS